MKEEMLRKASLNIIYNDCVALIEMSKLESPANFLMLPFISMIAFESLNFLKNNYNMNNLKNISNNSDIDIKKVRNGIKLFQYSFNKEINNLNNIDEIHHYYFKSKIKFLNSKLKYKNLGIFLNKQNEIVGNSFQQELILNLSEEDSSRRKREKQVLNYSIYIGRLLANIVTTINPSYFYKNDYTQIKKIKINWGNIDINTHRIKLSSYLNKSDFLYLLSLLSISNFVKNEIPIYTNNKQLIIRIKYISAYYIHRCLEKFYNVKCQSEYRYNYFKLEKTLLNKEAFNKEFRNCMAHYSLINKGISSISHNDYDETKLFFGLIDSCFKMNDDTYLALLDSKLEELSKLISNYVNLDNMYNL